jgi:tyrosyl-tRNA synthetase
LTDADLGELAGTIPTVAIPRGELEAGIAIVDLLVRVAVADSKGAARRLVTQGGAYVNNVRIADVEHRVKLTDLATETLFVVRGGKKDYRLVRAT